MRKLVFIFILSFLTLLTTHAVANSNKSNLILGRWQDEDCVKEYFKDGTFITNAYTGEKYTGTWNIIGNKLRLQFVTPQRVLNVYTIMELTDSKIKTKLSGFDGRIYNSRRITSIQSQQQSPVYITKNSNEYHRNRNCSNITTQNGLMKFDSPQEAEASGGVQCKHCDPSVVAKKANNPTKNIIPKAKKRPKELKNSSVKAQKHITPPLKGEKVSTKNKPHQTDIKKEIEPKRQEEQEEQNKQAQELVRSFSINGVKLGMTKSQVISLFPDGKLEENQLKIRNSAGGEVREGSEHSKYFAVTFTASSLYKEPIVYKIYLSEGFYQMGVKVTELLNKLKNEYGQWSDIYSQGNDHHAIVWGSKIVLKPSGSPVYQHPYNGALAVADTLSLQAEVRERRGLGGVSFFITLYDSHIGELDNTAHEQEMRGKELLEKQRVLDGLFQP